VKATLEQVTEGALALSPQERSRLTQTLIESLEAEPHDDSGVVAQAWEEEIARRIDDIKSGTVQGVPAEEVFAKLRAKYG
jgi:putative addiction module component (TIGR02574 family)